MADVFQNMDCMAKWLNGHSYVTKYRPIPIHEHLVYEGSIYPAATIGALIKTAGQLNSQKQTSIPVTPIRRIEPSAHKELRDPVLNAVITLAHETAAAGFGALVFAGSRGMCESDARLISRAMPQADEIDPTLLNKRLDLLGDLRSLSTGLDPVLGETILLGVAFHRKSPVGSPHQRHERS